MTAFDVLPDGLLVADAAGTVVSVNTAGAALLRRSAADIVGRDYREVLPLTDTVGRDWWACTQPYDGLKIRTGQPERRLMLPDERELYITARYVRENPCGPLRQLVVSFRGAGERERAERDRADLVSTVAHELRSPLTSVKGFTATLLNKWDRFNDEQRLLMLQTVNADADRVTRLIGELLDVSRIDAGRLELRKQVVDVPAAVRRLIDGRIVSGDSPDRFEIDVAEGLPEMWLDPDKLDQVLANLVDNAIRHGAGTVTIAITPASDSAEWAHPDGLRPGRGCGRGDPQSGISAILASRPPWRDRTRPLHRERPCRSAWRRGGSRRRARWWRVVSGHAPDRDAGVRALDSRRLSV